MTARGLAGWVQANLVLTPQEKKAVMCVLAAFFLGLATNHYRDAHPHVLDPPPAKAQKTSRSRRPARAEPTPIPQPSDSEVDG